MKDNVTYIAKRYKRGKFSIEKGWRRLDIKAASGWRRFRVAAAVASAVVLTATAAVIYHQHIIDRQPVHDVPESVMPATRIEAVKVIDFENTPLPAVISEIREVYGVEIDNIPENAGDYRLSLHYEGNAADLVATINDILETQMTVR